MWIGEDRTGEDRTGEDRTGEDRTDSLSEPEGKCKKARTTFMNSRNVNNYLLKLKITGYSLGRELILCQD